MKFDSKKVEVKGESFTVVELSAKQRQQVFKLFKSEDIDPVELQANYIQLGCKEFASSSIDEVMELPGSLFGLLADEIVKISGLADESSEDAEKNS